MNLEELPAGMGELTHLGKLLLGKEETDVRRTTRVTDNRLTSRLPSEIVQLTSLQSLDLSGKPLSELPSEIVQLMEAAAGGELPRSEVEKHGGSIICRLQLGQERPLPFLCPWVRK